MEHEIKSYIRVKNVGALESDWWKRSPRASDSTKFCKVHIVFSKGVTDYANASGTIGVAVGFCV